MFLEFYAIPRNGMSLTKFTVISSGAGYAFIFKLQILDNEAFK